MNSGNWTPAFLEAIQAEHNTAANTMLAYQRDLGSFADYLAANGRDLASATRQEVLQ